MTAHAQQDLLLDLAYGELSAGEARRVRAHLDGCAECRNELARIEGTRNLFSALPEVPAPEAGERILLAAAREAAERARPRSRLPRWLVPATALAATIAVVAAVALREGGEATGPLHRGDDRDVLMRAAAPAGEPEQAPAVGPGEHTGLGSAAGGREGKDAPPSYSRAPPALDAAKRRSREASAEEAPALALAPAAPASEQVQAPARVEEAAPAARGVGSLSAGRAGAPAESPPAKAEAENHLVHRNAATAAPRPTAAAAPAAEPPAARAGEADTLSPAQVWTFPGCAGETRREIGRDADGRVVRFAREGAAAGRRVRVEIRFGPDGALASTRARDLDTGEVLAADALPGLPRAAAQVDPDAAPRCGP